MCTPLIILVLAIICSLKLSFCMRNKYYQFLRLLAESKVRQIIIDYNSESFLSWNKSVIRVTLVCSKNILYTHSETLMSLIINSIHILIYKTVMNYIDFWKFQHLKCYQTDFLFVIIYVITYMLYLGIFNNVHGKVRNFELSPIYFDSNTSSNTRIGYFFV